MCLATYFLWHVPNSWQVWQGHPAYIIDDTAGRNKTETFTRRQYFCSGIFSLFNCSFLSVLKANGVAILFRVSYCVAWMFTMTTVDGRFSLARWSQRLALTDALAIRSPQNRLDFLWKQCNLGDHHAVGNVNIKVKCAALPKSSVFT